MGQNAAEASAVAAADNTFTVPAQQQALLLPVTAPDATAEPQAQSVTAGSEKEQEPGSAAEPALLDAQPSSSAPNQPAGANSSVPGITGTADGPHLQGQQRDSVPAEPAAEALEHHPSTEDQQEHVDSADDVSVPLEEGSSLDQGQAALAREAWGPTANGHAEPSLSGPAPDHAEEAAGNSLDDSRSVAELSHDAVDSLNGHDTPAEAVDSAELPSRDSYAESSASTCERPPGGDVSSAGLPENGAARHHPSMVS